VGVGACVRVEATSLCQRGQDLVVGGLGLVAGVEQQRVTLGPPGIVVAHTPNGDTDAVLLADASLDNVGPVGGGGVLDVDFGHGTLRCGATESSHGGDGVGALAGGQVGLRADTVDGDAGSDPLLDVLDHSLRLGVRGRVQAESC
jgi:hypothetical protein